MKFISTGNATAAETCNRAKPTQTIPDLDIGLTTRWGWSGKHGLMRQPVHASGGVHDADLIMGQISYGIMGH